MLAKRGYGGPAQTSDARATRPGFESHLCGFSDRTLGKLPNCWAQSGEQSLGSSEALRASTTSGRSTPKWAGF